MKREKKEVMWAGIFICQITEDHLENTTSDTMDIKRQSVSSSLSATANVIGNSDDWFANICEQFQ